MKEKKDRRKKSSDSPLDMLRILHTNLSQDEFAMLCGISRASYQRWISGKCEVRLSIPQIKKMCRILGMSLEDLPDSLEPSGQAEV